MTGIFGYCNRTINQDKILKSVNNIKYNIGDTFVTSSCILGNTHVHSTIEKKTNLKTENGITIITCGEIYNEDISDLQKTIIDFYETGNLDHLKDLNGSFAAVLYDIRTNKLILMNDRYGTIKLFYYYDADCFCFAPKIQPLLEWGVKKTVRKDALFDFFIFSFLLEDKTFFEDIYQLPPASILEYSKGDLKINQYWNYDFNYQNYDTRPTGQLIDDLGKIWEKSVKRRIKKGEKIIIPLSGGIDSRAILAAVLNYSSKDDIITFTFGERGSFDFEIGNIIAKNTDIRNISLGVEKKDFENQYRISFNDIEGMIDVTPYFAIKGFQELKTSGNRIFSGFMGGEIMGSLVLPKMVNFRLKSKRDYDRAGNLIFNWRKRHTFKIVKKLCSPLLKDLPNYKQSFNKSIGDINKTDSNEFINYCTTWLYKNEEWNYTLFCVLRFNNLFKYSIPFLDNEIVDFMVKIPPNLRLNKYLYKSMLLKKYPEFFKLPTKNNFGYGLDADNVLIFMSRIFLYLKRKSNSIFNKAIKRNLFLDKNINYIDYNDLLRTNKEYQEFFSRYINKVKEREYFNKEFIETIWKLQINGKKNYATILGLLVTFELLLENNVDPL